MLGSAYKKYAEELGFRITDGVAYGEYKGYLVTIKEGSGWKSMTFAVSFPDEVSRASVINRLNDTAFLQSQGIRNASYTNSLIEITFVDTIGTMKRIRPFAEAFSDELKAWGVRGVDCCNACGKELNGQPVATLLIADNVFLMDEVCAEETTKACRVEADAVLSSGNMSTGVLGAAIGGLVGVIPWTIVSIMGWFVGWLGFLIGLAAKKGYEIGKGKETKAKGITILVVVLLAVLLAEYIGLSLSLTWSWMDMYPEAGFVVNLYDAFTQLPLILMQDSEILVTVIFDVILGWVFAILGVFSTLKQIFLSAKIATAIPKRLD